MNGTAPAAGTAPPPDRGGVRPRFRSFDEAEFGIHQVLAAAAPGDAITNAALEYREVLRRIGPSEVFARHIAPSTAGEVRPLSDFGSTNAHGVLLYHASIGEPAVTSFLLSRHEPIVLVYHNITPARYFEGLDNTFADLLMLGRAELEVLRHRVKVAVAASRFNAAELEDFGYRDVKVIPPVVNPYRLVHTEPDAGTLTHLEREIPGPIVLFVGQLLPHKRPDLLVKAMHIAASYGGSEATLLLVGPNRFARYGDAISAEIHELNLPQVHLMGAVSDAQLAAIYRRATVFVTASEHEGFCVPLLEAMAFDVPVVARACAAIPETVGGGGLLVPEWTGPELLAEAIERVVRDAPLRRELARRGRARLEELTAADASVEMLEAIGRAV